MSSEASQTKAKYVQEAKEIYAWLVDRQELAHALIWQSTKGIKDRDEAGDARLDLHCLAVTLAKAQSSAVEKPNWEIYKNHFVGQGRRQKFFVDLQKLTRRIGSACLASFGGLIQFSDKCDDVFRWNNSLLPSASAPHVLRLAIFHPNVLEHFLPRFFVEASELSAQKSTFRRKVRILDNVAKFGWSAAKHAEALIGCGDLDSSVKGSEVETVKKLIRDLRIRYRNYLREASNK